MENENSCKIHFPTTFWGYDFYVFRRKDGCWVVKAITTYKGEKITATAKCHPNDNFVYEIGRRLAWARCEEKIAYKKCVRASKWIENAEVAMARAQKRYDKAEREFNAYVKHYTVMNEFVNKETEKWND